MNDFPKIELLPKGNVICEVHSQKFYKGQSQIRSDSYFALAFVGITN